MVSYRKLRMSEWLRANPPAFLSAGIITDRGSSGRLIFHIGAVAVTADDEHVGAGDFGVQLEQVFRNLIQPFGLQADVEDIRS